MISPSPVDLIRGYSAPVFLFSSSSLSASFHSRVPRGCFVSYWKVLPVSARYRAPSIIAIVQVLQMLWRQNLMYTRDVNQSLSWRHIWWYICPNIESSRRLCAHLHRPQCLNDISACVCVCVCIGSGIFLASIKQCCVSVCLHWGWQTALTLNTLCCSNSPQLSCHLHTHISVCWHTVAHSQAVRVVLCAFTGVVCVCVRAGLCFHCSNELFHTLNPQFFWHAVQIKTLHCSVFQNKFSVVIPYIRIHARLFLLSIIFFFQSSFTLCSLSYLLKLKFSTVSHYAVFPNFLMFMYLNCFCDGPQMKVMV